MKSSIRACVATAVTTLGLIATNGQAKAFSLTGATLSIAMECNNDISTLVIDKTPKGAWQYAYDAAGDGSGGLHYEIYGMGVMQDAKYAYFAINAYDMQKDAGIDTVDSQGKVTEYKVGWGDLLISTQGQSIAKDNGNIFGIHFGGNSAGVSQVGLYSNVTAKSVGKIHHGYDSISSVIEHGKASKVISFDEYLKQKGFTDTYKTASSQQNWSVSNYLKTLPVEDQKAYAKKDWSITEYVKTLTSTERNAYNYADQFLSNELTFNQYLSKQSSTIKNAYTKGNQAAKDQIKKDLISGAQNIVSNTTNAFNNLKEEVQTKVNTITSNYERFKQDAKNTIAQIRAPHDELTKNFYNTLFGELSNDQASAYFDKAVSNDIQSGKWLGGIEMLNLEQLVQAGYNKDAFTGNQTIAFRIARSVYSPESVPEPTTLLGLAAFGFGLTTGRFRQRHR